MNVGQLITELQKHPPELEVDLLVDFASGATAKLLFKEGALVHGSVAATLNAVEVLDGLEEGSAPHEKVVSLSAHPK